jgi:hypothetical protein
MGSEVWPVSAGMLPTVHGARHRSVRAMCAAVSLAVALGSSATSWISPVALSSVVLWAAAPSGARAQAPSAEPTAADRQAAGQAYDRATAAYLARDYARAATLFETAYRLAPASASLLQAVRAHDRAGNGLRAATLALRLQAFYGSDEAAARQAATTLAATRSQFLRIDVTCGAPCTLELDGVLQEHSSFYAAPGDEHTVRATFETGTSERTTRGAAGAVETLSFEPPPAAVAVGGPGDAAARASSRVGPRASDPVPAAAAEAPAEGAGLGLEAFVIALVATVAAGGVLAWSGVDALDGVPAYRDMPTVERLRDGQSRELRTNVLIGVTSALALTTFVLALATDWDGAPERASEGPRVSAFVTPEAGMLTVGGRFR